MHAAACNWTVFERDARLRRIKLFVEYDLTRRLTAGEAARVAGLNATYFCSFFREKVGVRFTEWDRHVRIQRAKELIVETSRPLGEIAFDVGYTDLRTFQRNFKRETSMTARGFREVVRTSHLRDH
ncbi:MAG: helix-turn-helix transcriptional regulator [bacterium]|nr:helix-turn-helix transcriptional regulator [bacterium]